MTSDAPLILVVEDEEVVRRITSAALAASQFRVIEAETGETALSEVATRHPDVILLDMGLPDMSGLEVIRQLGNAPHAPVVVFSAGSLQHTILAAIDAGAVDFVAKPFLIADLLSQLRRVLQGANQLTMPGSTRLKVGDIEMDLIDGTATVGKRTIHLTPLESRLFAVVMSNSGRLLTYEFLIHQISEPGAAFDKSVLSSLTAQLRHKLEPDPLRPRYLTAEMGIGYRFFDDMNCGHDE